METAKCNKCENVNEVKVSTGHTKPENKGRMYFTCTNCKQFQWVEGVSTTPTSPVEALQAPENTNDTYRAEKKEEARGKVRNSIAVAFIGAFGPSLGLEDLKLTDEKIAEMEIYVEWVMEGK